MKRVLQEAQRILSAVFYSVDRFYLYSMVCYGEDGKQQRPQGGSRKNQHAVAQEKV